MDSNINLKRYINHSKKIAIFSHINPDADAIGSSFALRDIIKNNFQNKVVDVFIDGEIGDLYDLLLNGEKTTQNLDSSYDLAFVLDCPKLDRIGKYKDFIESVPTIINIDHHQTNEYFAKVNIVDSKVSSTCEKIYSIAVSQRFKLSDEIAEKLYHGMITDTNNFKSPSVNFETCQTKQKLSKYNFDFESIEAYYFTDSEGKKKLREETFKLMKKYKDLTIVKIKNKLLKKLGIGFDDTYGIVDDVMNKGKTAVAAYLIEKQPKQIYCSLRGNGEINIGNLAEFFQGGGSEKIGAFQSQKSMKRLKKMIVKTIKENKDVSKKEFLR